MLKIPDVQLDEMTEIVKSFRILDTEGFYALVYWKARLLSYEFILATFLPDGYLIDQKVIARTSSQNGSIYQLVCTIEEDWTIQLNEGTAENEHSLYEPEQSQSYTMELLNTGEIIFLLDDE